MGRLSKRNAAFAAAAAVVLVAVTLATLGGGDGKKSVQTVDRTDPVAGPVVVDSAPDTGGQSGSTQTSDLTARATRTVPGGTVTFSTPLGPASPAASDPALVPAGFRIGYRYTDPDSPSAVVVSRFDFTDERVLFTAPPGAIYTTAEFSPNSERLLIGYCLGVSPCSIHTVTTDGVASAALDDGQRPIWSPDGRSILSVKPASDTREALWVVPSEGGTAIKIGDAGGGCCGVDPRWSPDSTRVGYTDPERHALRIALRNGTYDRSYYDPRDLLEDVSETRFEWSPDGESLMVERLVRADGADASSAVPQVAILDVSSGRWEELGAWHAIDWMPDGESVIVQRPRSAATADRNCGTAREIGALHIATGAFRTFGDGCSAKLSPDRTLLAVAEIARARVIRLGGTNDQGTVVYESDGGYRSRGSQLLCCAWTPGSDALLLTDAEVVVARIDGRARWQYRSTP